MDKEYWKEFYKNKKGDQNPSLFAQFVLKNYCKDEKYDLIELGCGNGRDSLFLSKNGIKVLAIDQVKEEITNLSDQFGNNESLQFKCSDFTNLGNERTFDIAYSRFTLHSINLIEQKRVLSWVYKQLNITGLFCIEVRGKKNELFKKGKKVANEGNAYIYEDHYRRFIDLDIFCTELNNLGFTIEYAQESKGFAPYNNSDEAFIRVIAKK